MIDRDIKKELLQLLTEYSVVTILGPRQSGKTTLALKNLKDYQYYNLEDPEIRHIALNDPKAFLKQFTGRVIVDEIQRAPELLSYIQVIVDKNKIKGQFVLTGSHQLKLNEQITQSLAGRTAILNLLPLSINELNNFGISYDSFLEYSFNGFYPRVYAEKLRVSRMYSNYYKTYIERDVRQLINIKDLLLFEKFMHLVAGRVGQVIDYTSLANDVGVSSKTIQNWISILEASFIVYKLKPYYNNFGKRVIKSAKLYFYDTGLLCYLLEIKNVSHLKRDPLLGSIFENLIILEVIKYFSNQGLDPNIYFFRDSNGNEVDLLIKIHNLIISIEIKSATTFNIRYLKGLKAFSKLNDNKNVSCLVYNGDNYSLSEGVNVINYKSISNFLNEYNT